MPARFDEVASHHEILVHERAGMEPIGADAADDGRQMDHDFGAFALEHAPGVSGASEVEFGAARHDHVPAAACIDTCHTHVAGYDVTSKEGFAETLGKLDATIGLKNIPVWHCNDAKAARGSKLDRHQHIGQGSIGPEPFRWLLKDSRLAHAAFIAETPIDNPGDDRRNVDALKKLAK